MEIQECSTMEAEVSSNTELIEELKIKNRIFEIFFNCPGDSIYEEIMQFILPVFSSTHGVFGYFSGDGLFVVRSLTSDISGELIQVRDREITFKPSSLEGIWGRAVNEQQTLYANDGDIPLPREHIPIENAMVAPVLYKEKLISAIFLANKQGGYNEVDQKLLEMIARQVAPVLHARMELNRELAEKETLMREIFHRTKNNLQVILSMLKLQAEFSDDEGSQATIKSMENRIYAMLLVHRKLYQNNDPARVNLRDYLHELAHQLMRNYKDNSKRIVMQLDIDDFDVLIDVAVPCGLIVNELMSNALKHAFPDEKQGKIRIRLSRSRKKDIELVVADSGIGFPKGFKVEENKSLGFRTIFTIARHQLQGSVKFESRGGVSCFVCFSDKVYEEQEQKRMEMVRHEVI